MTLANDFFSIAFNATHEKNEALVHPRAVAFIERFTEAPIEPETLQHIAACSGHVYAAIYAEIANKRGGEDGLLVTRHGDCVVLAGVYKNPPPFIQQLLGDRVLPDAAESVYTQLLFTMARDPGLIDRLVQSAILYGHWLAQQDTAIVGYQEPQVLVGEQGKSNEL